MKHGVNGHQTIRMVIDDLEWKSTQTKHLKASTNLLVSLGIFANVTNCNLDLSNKPVGGKQTPFAIPFCGFMITPSEPPR